MQIRCKFTISRNSRDVITIQVTDALSRVQFLELEMSPEVFALALTGLAYQEVNGEVRGLDVVGKSREVEDRRAVYSHGGYAEREVMREWLRENCQEDGWVLDDYLGSRNSVTTDAEGNTVLHYRVIRFVEEPTP